MIDDSAGRLLVPSPTDTDEAAIIAIGFLEDRPSRIPRTMAGHHLFDVHTTEFGHDILHLRARGRTQVKPADHHVYVVIQEIVGPRDHVDDPRTVSYTHLTLPTN